MTITLDTPFKELVFRLCSTSPGARIMSAKTNHGTLSICEWEPCYGFGALDSSFLAPNGSLWVASGGLDVRHSGAGTLGDAIKWVKNNHTSFYSAGDQK